MKDPVQRTKVVIRHLPPTLSHSDLSSQIDARFSDRYNWFAFRPGKISHRHQRHSRAYIDFKRPEDVLEFAAFFNGHVFVNEKGAQYKALVEYAPSQRVPKPNTKKDAREGTIYKDPDYLEFLKLIAKPAENLPSAEIQLERKEAELSGAAKESPIVTPLMEYVRQKRAVEKGNQGLPDVRKPSRRARNSSSGKHGSSSKRNAEKKKQYVQKDSTKNTSRKAKSTYVAVPKQDDKVVASSGKRPSETETVAGIGSSLSGVTLTTDSGKKKILLLKKDRDYHPTEQQSEVSSAGNSSVPPTSRPNQRREAGGKLIRSILMRNENSQGSSSTSSQPHPKGPVVNTDNKPPPRSVNPRSDDKFTRKDHHGSGVIGEKQEKRLSNKERPDRVWAPLRRSDASHTGEEPNGELKDELSSRRSAETEVSSGGRHLDNVCVRHGRRIVTQNMKDERSAVASEGKSSKRGGPNFSAHEKQMWVQKSSSG